MNKSLAISTSNYCTWRQTSQTLVTLSVFSLVEVIGCRYLDTQRFPSYRNTWYLKRSDESATKYWVVANFEVEKVF